MIIQIFATSWDKSGREFLGKWNLIVKKKMEMVTCPFLGYQENQKESSVEGRIWRWIDMNSIHKSAK